MFNHACAGARVPGGRSLSLDVVDLRAFYASPLGHVARRFVGDVALRFWPDVRGLRVAGIGFAVPYLALLREGTERTLALMPATQGVVNWPSSGLSASVLVEPTALPLPDASIDRIMVIHALEESESPEELLEEVWRVLGPGGRVLAVVPSRRGLWARMDTTPFGHGRPYSRSQLEALMRDVGTRAGTETVRNVQAIANSPAARSCLAAQGLPGLPA